jgi:hypothetical protein
MPKFTKGQLVKFVDRDSINCKHLEPGAMGVITYTPRNGSVFINHYYYVDFGLSKEETKGWLTRGKNGLKMFAAELVAVFPEPSMVTNILGAH